jgi:hypothetical protein
MATFNLRNSFSKFDVDKLVSLVEIYAENFHIGDLSLLSNQLRQFVNHARRTLDFIRCTNLEKLLKLWSRLVCTVLINWFVVSLN